MQENENPTSAIQQQITSPHLEKMRIKRGYNILQIVIMAHFIIAFVLFLLPIWYKSCDTLKFIPKNFFQMSVRNHNLDIVPFIVLILVIVSAICLLKKKISKGLQICISIICFVAVGPFAPYVIFCGLFSGFMDTCNDYYSSGIGYLSIGLIALAIFPYVIGAQVCASKYAKIAKTSPTTV